MKFIPRKIPTAQSLANVALHYLERYAASEASLRRVLQNRLRRAAMDHPTFATDEAHNDTLRSAIETIVENHKKNGVINDATFAETKVQSLRRQGRSRRAIEQKLMAKGVERAKIAHALVQHAAGKDAEAEELQAALHLAKRRKLGPFRQKAMTEDLKRKEFATLARAGFSSDIAQKVLRAEFSNND